MKQTVCYICSFFKNTVGRECPKVELYVKEVKSIIPFKASYAIQKHPKLKLETNLSNTFNNIKWLKLWWLNRLL